ncbi:MULTISPECIES: response regulator [unclassified Methylophilus]|uniref:response regulator n=1 Tax=unclassified Methylophilus TaxID=2630143 RepID=UPI0006FD2EC9|nr:MULTISPECIES: response regulator [unclassified Methylophilus]KQT41177.1 two-component system response regulator [Methylophilus sp. Leaf416]KQT58387.1 two-component system response regulator [Methylophilus sp. Leaf459]
MQIQPKQNYKEVTLLIVDDDDIDAIALERALRKMRLLNTVLRARDGREALDLLRSGAVPQPYIILLDLNMPRMSGLEFLKMLRTDPQLTHAVVFVLTTSKSDEDLVAAYRKHVAGYVFKQHMDRDFMEVIGFIEHYWRLVELPVTKE